MINVYFDKPSYPYCKEHVLVEVPWFGYKCKKCGKPFPMPSWRLEGMIDMNET
jgi:hypothetical protein